MVQHISITFISFLAIIFSFSSDITGGVDDWRYVVSNHLYPNPAMRNISSMVIRGDSLWASTPGGLMLYSISTGETMFFNKPLGTLALDSSGGLFILVMYDSSFYFKDGVWSSFFKIGIRTCITTDNEGCAWIPKVNGLGGLERYDGYLWSTFDNLNSSLPDGFFIRSMCYVPDGSLWLGTRMHGLWKFDRKSSAMQISGTYSDLINGQIIGQLIVDNENIVWFGAEGSRSVEPGGLFCYDGLSIKSFTDNANLPGNRVTALLAGSDNKIYVGRSEMLVPSGLDGAAGGLAVYDKTRDSWVHFDTDNSNLPDNNINCLAKDNSGGIWIGTRDCGLIKFENNSFQTKFCPIPSYAISQFSSDNAAGFWLYSRYLDQGVIHWDGQAKWTQFLKGKTIQSISSGNGNELWVGTIENGIFHFDGSSWINHGPANGLTGNRADLVLVDNKNNHIWANISNKDGDNVFTYKGLGLFDGISWKYFTTSNSSIPSDTIRQMCLDKNGKLWMAFNPGFPIAAFDGTTWSIYDINPIEGGSLQITGIASDSMNNIWIGAWSKGLFKFNENGILQLYSFDKTQLTTNDVSTIMVDRSGSVWCGVNARQISTQGSHSSTYVGGGLAKYSNDEWAYYNYDNSDMPPLFCREIYQLWAGDSNRIWASTTDGFCSFHDNSFLKIKTPIAATNSDYLIKSIPNPFKPETHVSFILKNAGVIELNVFDIHGKKVRLLSKGKWDAGQHLISWNGHDDSNRPLSSGMYWLRLSVNGQQKTIKVQLLK